VIIGGVLFAIGVLWFGWSGYRKDIHWIVPTLSGLFTGFGIMSIFLQCLNYLIVSAWDWSPYRSKQMLTPMTRMRI